MLSRKWFASSRIRGALITSMVLAASALVTLIHPGAAEGSNGQTRVILNPSRTIGQVPGGHRIGQSVPCNVTADGSASATFLAKFDAPCDVHQSGIFEDSSTGRVGIGTTTPFGAFDINAPDQIGLFVRGPYQGVGAALDLKTNSFLGVQWEILDTGSTAAQGPRRLNIRNVGTHLDVLTIRANGWIGMNTINPDSTLSVNGAADKPGGGSWATFSDGRLKTTEAAYDAGLDAILKLTPIRYHYRAHNAMGIKDRDEHVGFVAQDVRKVIPEAVSSNDRGYLLVNNDPILWAMLNAIKQQQHQIKQQQVAMVQLTHEVRDVRQVRTENVSLRHELASLSAQVRQIRAGMTTAQAQYTQTATRTSGN